MKRSGTEQTSTLFQESLFPFVQQRFGDIVFADNLGTGTFAPLGLNNQLEFKFRRVFAKFSSGHLGPPWCLSLL